MTNFLIRKPKIGKSTLLTVIVEKSLPVTVGMPKNIAVSNMKKTPPAYSYDGGVCKKYCFFYYSAFSCRRVACKPFPDTFSSISPADSFD